MTAPFVASLGQTSFGAHVLRQAAAGRGVRGGRFALWLACAVLAAPGCSKPVDEPASTFKPAQGAPAPPAPTKLEIQDIVVGTGKVAQAGATVHVQYTGTLMNGEKFDSTHDRDDEPFTFTLGKGEVIKGWDEGVVGMRVGGRRKLRIPPELGYGESGSPPTIPPNAGLVFDVELVGVD